MRKRKSRRQRRRRNKRRRRRRRMRRRRRRLYSRKTNLPLPLTTTKMPIMVSMLVLLLINLVIARNGPRLANAFSVLSATGPPLTLPKTKIKMQVVMVPRPMPVPKAKAKTKTVLSKSADDLLLRTPAQLHLKPGSEASPLLAKPIGLPVIGGLRVFVPIRSASIGIPASAKISRKMENARKELNANSCI